MHSDSPAPTADFAAVGAWSSRQLWLLLGITVFAAALRLLHVGAWSWSHAEADTWRAMTSPLDGPAGFFASSECWQPLVYLALRWLSDAGLLGASNEGWLRLPFVFAGTLTVPLLALAGCHAVGRSASIVAALLLAMHPLHVEISQSAQPLAVALLLGLAGAAAAHRRRLWLAGMLLLAAGASHPLAWSCAAVAGALLLPARWRRHALVPAALLGALALCFQIAPVSLPILVLAAGAACIVRPLPPGLVLGAALPAIVVSAAALAGGRAIADGGVVLALPALTLLAAAALVHVYELAAERIPGPGLLAVGSAALVAATAITWLGTDAFLYETLQGGRRPPWRGAADAALATADGGGGLVVGAGAGAAPLTCYLRPLHWRLPTNDAHPGVRVVPLDFAEPEAATASIAAFAEHATADHVLLVMHADEKAVIAADPGAARALDAAFALLHVLPGPRVTYDDTLWIWRRKPGR